MNMLTIYFSSTFSYFHQFKRHLANPTSTSYGDSFTIPYTYFHTYLKISMKTCWKKFDCCKNWCRYNIFTFQHCSQITSCISPSSLKTIMSHPRLAAKTSSHVTFDVVHSYWIYWIIKKRYNTNVTFIH